MSSSHKNALSRQRSYLLSCQRKLASSAFPRTPKKHWMPACAGMTRIIFTTITTLLLSPPCFAIFCPTNFNSIDVGDTIDRAQQACGKPDGQRTYNAEENTPQEWSYFLSQAVPASIGMTSQGTLKTSVAFDEKGVVNISVNGIGVSTTAICGSTVQLGDSKEKVKAACGDPSFINKSNVSPSSTPPKPPSKITEFFYSTTPPTILVFVDGKFTERK